MMINYNRNSPVAEPFSCNKMGEIFWSKQFTNETIKLILLMVNTTTTLPYISHHWLLSQQKVSANSFLLVCHYRNVVDSHWVHKQSNKPRHQQRYQATTLDLLLYLLRLLQNGSFPHHHHGPLNFHFQQLFQPQNVLRSNLHQHLQ